MKELILISPQRKNFYAMDVGAGDGRWSKSLASYLEKQNDLPSHFHLSIINLGGEKFSEEKIKSINKNITTFNFGNFKIEDISKELINNGLDLTNNIDLIVSRMCLRHLIDPIGTFTQLIDLSRPKGFICIDEFAFLLNDELFLNKNKENSKDRMTELLLHAGTNFILESNSNIPINIVASKNEPVKCQLPLTYEGLVFNNSLFHRFNDLGYLTKYSTNRESYNQNKIVSRKKYEIDTHQTQNKRLLEGSEDSFEMLDWLRKSELFNSSFYSNWNENANKNLNFH